mmetsp:Transcript_40237/g.64466  ORF Transcript_40237/g.64466 Transcript_40237/m.64466 type:complete len:389 (+) Transcript_40237:76-1242(+)
MGILQQSFSWMRTYWSALPPIYRKIAVGAGIYVGLTSLMTWSVGVVFNNSLWCSPKLRQRRQFNGNTYAIVTGANGGIGKEIAKQLMLDGCNVVVACRNQQKAEAVIRELTAISQQRKEKAPTAKHGKLVFIKLDLASKQSVDEFIEKFLSLKVECNILIHNAAITTSKPNPFCEQDNMNVMWQCNHLSQFYLTLALLPHIVHATNKHQFGRIVNLNSIFHRDGRAADIEYFMDDARRNDRSYLDANVNTTGVGLYNSTKLANVLFVHKLHEYVQSNFPHVMPYLCVCCVHPGIVDTPLLMQTRLISHPLLYTQWRCFCLLSAEQGAIQVLHTVHCDMDNAKYLANGKYHTNGAYVAYTEKTKALIQAYADKLWNKSLEIWPIDMDTR